MTTTQFLKPAVDFSGVVPTVGMCRQPPFITRRSESYHSFHLLIYLIL